MILGTNGLRHLIDCAKKHTAQSHAAYFQVQHEPAAVGVGMPDQIRALQPSDLQVEALPIGQAQMSERVLASLRLQAATLVHAQSFTQ